MNTKHQFVCVAEIVRIDKWVRKFRLEPACPGQKLAPFLPGQYLNIFYEIDGVKTTRPYSIASSPRDAENGFYELYIHSGGGFTSPWLCAHAQVGTRLEVSVPEGEFHPVDSRDGKHIIGISGGMSVTPLRSMAKAVVDGTLDADLTLFCGWDTSEDMLFWDDYAAWAKICPRFKAVFLLANEQKENCESGFVSLELIRKYVNPDQAAFFMCGPPEMYRTLDRELSPLNIPPEKYHRELPGEVKAGAAGTEGIVPHKAFTVTVRRENHERTIPAQSQETLLVALERAGITPEVRCRSGHCGYCEMRLISGKYFVPEGWQDQTNPDKPQQIHPCRSFPLSDLTVELV